MNDIKREKVIKDLYRKMEEIFSRNLTNEEKAAINLGFTAGMIYQLDREIAGKDKS